MVLFCTVHGKVYSGTTSMGIILGKYLPSCVIGREILPLFGLQKFTLSISKFSLTDSSKLLDFSKSLDLSGLDVEEQEEAARFCEEVVQESIQRVKINSF